VSADQLAKRVALISIFLSAGLAAVKITVGLKAGSTAVVSDGIESAGDVLASGLVLFGLVIALRPPDAEHPYGHGRVETLTALGVGMLLITTGALICYGSIERSFHSENAPATFAMWPLVGSIVVKSATWSAKRHYGRRICSDALTADAWNDAVDIFSGMTALAALGLSLYNPIRFGAADHIGGSAVGLIVVFLGIHVVRDTTMQLMDTMPDPNLLEQIRAAALSVPGVLAVEKCYARKTGFKYHVDLHLEVDPAMTVRDSHGIATQARTVIRERLDWVADVLVHVEPHLHSETIATIADRTHGES
jgi:cation diffusion facilitator family transporter